MNNFLKKLFMILPILVAAALVAGFLPTILSLANPGGVNQTEGNSMQPAVVTANVDDRNSAQFQTSQQAPVFRITQDKAREIALEKVDGAIVKFEFDDDKYEIEILASGKKYEFEINGYTGKITEFKVNELKNDDKVSSTKPAETTLMPQASTTAKRSRISAEKARDIALEKIDGRIIKLELDDDKYEVEIHANGKKYEFEINGYTGKITEFKVDDLKGDDKVRSTKPAATTPTTRTSSAAKRSRISAEKAREIALGKVSGKVVEFELDDNKYEIEIQANGKKYELEINAYTGKITEFQVGDLKDDDHAGGDPDDQFDHDNNDEHEDQADHENNDAHDNNDDHDEHDDGEDD